MKFNFEVEVSMAKSAKPAVSAEMESAIERAAYDALEALLDPDDLDVSVTEA
jgi:hypothetical protein